MEVIDVEVLRSLFEKKTRGDCDVAVIIQYNPQKENNTHLVRSGLWGHRRPAVRAIKKIPIYTTLAYIFPA